MDVDKLYPIMNNELLKVTNWCNANVLSINAKKTVYMLFYRARKKLLVDHSLYIRDFILARHDIWKFLGTFVDQCLTFKPHIQYLTNKVSKNIGIISPIRRYITSSIAITLYYSFIYPNLSYCNLVWASNYSYYFPCLNFRRYPRIALH